MTQVKGAPWRCAVVAHGAWVLLSGESSHFLSETCPWCPVCLDANSSCRGCPPITDALSSGLATPRTHKLIPTMGHSPWLFLPGRSFPGHFNAMTSEGSPLLQAMMDTPWPCHLFTYLCECVVSACHVAVVSKCMLSTRKAQEEDLSPSGAVREGFLEEVAGLGVCGYWVENRRCCALADGLVQLRLCSRWLVLRRDKRPGFLAHGATWHRLAVGRAPVPRCDGPG
jgi:hypothetical protein